MKLSRKVGAVSQILQVFIRDSLSTTGAGLTGLTNASSSLTAYFHRDTDTTATAISLVSMTVGTFTSSGFKEIDSVNMPGWYQFCPPNTAFASGAASVAFHLQGAANMAPLPIEVDLDSQVDVALWNGTAVASPATAGVPDVNVKNVNNISASSVTTVSANQGTTQPVNFTGTGGSALVKGDAIDLAGQAITAAAGVTFPSSVASPTNITAGTITNLTNAPTAGDFTSTMKTSLNAATPVVTLAAAALAAIWDRLTSALTTSGSIGKLLVDNIDAAISSRLASASISLSAGAVTVGTNNDKTGYALTSAYDLAKTAAQAGDAMALTSGERTTLAGVIWSNAARTLTSFGTLAADVTTAVWAAATRTLTAFGFTAQVADKVLGRNVAGGSDGGRTVSQALYPLRNKVDTISAPGFLIVYGTDDTTESFRTALATDATAEPIVTSSPTT